MTTDPPESPPTDLTPLAAALRAGAWPAAEALVAARAPAAVRSLADSLIRCRRWRDAAWLLDRILHGRTLADDVKRNMARNFAALQRHRPAVYERVVDLPDDSRFGIAPAASGALTILAQRDDGSALSLAVAGADPAGGARHVVAQLEPHIRSGVQIGLCGVGDGHLLSQLSAARVERFLGMEQMLFLIEPEARLVLLCLMIHDLTGPNGPIEQPRVRWFVGPTWQGDLAAAVQADPFLGLPAVTVAQGPRGAEVRVAIEAMTSKVAEADRQQAAELATYYHLLGPADLADVMAGRADRRPRVLLLTTRFSTVLQYSTRDAARGFEEAGWDAQVLIEPSPAHRLFQPAIRRALHEFRPDLVLQIDHLRHEHGDLFPPGLPFACWIQDHLPNLMNPAAGARVGALDYVMTDAASTYRGNYGYPARQFIAMSKLTQAPAGAAPAGSDEIVDDLSFVSNASRTPAAMLAATEQHFGGDAACRGLAVEAGRRLIDLYDAGESLPNYVDIAELLRSVQSDLRLRVADESFHDIAKWLCHPFNDALYRQQALRWSAAAANEFGLRFSLYGTGWDKHPDFAPFARGPVEYGESLRAMTRRTAINLQVVPYFCLHQRLLDGLVAGGFFLVRSHPSDVAPQAMSSLLLQHFPESVRTLAAARAVAPPPVRDRFESLVRACRRCLCPMGDEDPIEMVRAWETAELLVPGAGAVLPGLQDVSFDSAAGVRSLIERFARDREARGALAVRQRESVAARLSYAAGMGRVGRTVAGLLDRTATESRATARLQRTGARAA
jgi:hypothetical protein